MTSRERVKAAVRFEKPDRLPRHIWTIPWAVTRYGAQLEKIRQRYPEDICWADGVYVTPACQSGDPYAVGEYVDEWGCRFLNIQAGLIGEVRDPMIADWENMSSFEPPFGMLPKDETAAIDKVNTFCAGTEKFVLSGCGPRPWERYQFLRGTENSLVDLVLEPEKATELLRRIHDFYLQELEFWVKTDIDGIFFQDDWGSQQALLINPEQWRETFKPLYKDYCDMAHSAGKFAFMHSDGNILSIYPDLIEVGVDAVNSQLATMDLAELARVARGRVTFWGEIDRQHVLTNPDRDTARAEVRRIASNLYSPDGGMIAQLSYDLAVVPGTVMTVFEEWERIK